MTISNFGLPQVENISTHRLRPDFKSERPQKKSGVSVSSAIEFYLQVSVVVL